MIVWCAPLLKRLQKDESILRRRKMIPMLSDINHYEDCLLWLTLCSVTALVSGTRWRSINTVTPWSYESWILGFQFSCTIINCVIVRWENLNDVVEWKDEKGGKWKTQKGVKIEGNQKQPRIPRKSKTKKKLEPRQCYPSLWLRYFYELSWLLEEDTPAEPATCLCQASSSYAERSKCFCPGWTEQFEWPRYADKRKILECPQMSLSCLPILQRSNGNVTSIILENAESLVDQTSHHPQTRWRNPSKWHRSIVIPAK